MNAEFKSQSEEEKAATRAELEAKVGQVWDTKQLTDDFEVRGFGFGLCVVIRRSDGVLGSLDFMHYPRFYFGFTPHERKG